MINFTIDFPTVNEIQTKTLQAVADRREIIEELFNSSPELTAIIRLTLVQQEINQSLILTTQAGFSAIQRQHLINAAIEIETFLQQAIAHAFTLFQGLDVTETDIYEWIDSQLMTQP